MNSPKGKEIQSIPEVHKTLTEKPTSHKHPPKIGQQYLRWQEVFYLLPVINNRRKLKASKGGGEHSER